jgi:hypothetical protein
MLTYECLCNTCKFRKDTCIFRVRHGNRYHNPHLEIHYPIMRPLRKSILLTLPCHLIRRLTIELFLRSSNSKNNTKRRPVQIIRFIPTLQKKSPPYDRISIIFTRYSTALKRLNLFIYGISIVTAFQKNKTCHKALFQ